MNDELITAEELGQHLRMSPYTLRDWARAGRIPSHKLSYKIRRFRLQEVVEALCGQRIRRKEK